MLESPAYNVEDLWNDGEFLLSRVRGPGKHERFLRVSPSQRRPSPESVARLTRAFDLRDVLDSRWAAKPVAIERPQGLTVLLLDDPGGEPLARLNGKPWDLEPFLQFAIGLAHSLALMHDCHIVHGDLKPANILLDRESHEVRLRGFGVRSGSLSTATQPPIDQIISGTLAYMAPEQTAVMNRSIDWRSDLYSSGIVFYELLAGELPFRASHPSEWIHCHIARRPKAFDQRLHVPPAVASIVFKLLSKNAEDRYQTASGLMADLQRCLTDLNETGAVDAFPLGKADVPNRLSPPEKLYGREQQLETLFAAYARVANHGTTEVVLVRGRAGAGKSSLIGEVQRSLVSSHTLVAAGKFDQYKRDIPYAAFAQALAGLATIATSRPDLAQRDIRATLQQTLGSTSSLIVNLVPELAELLGEEAGGSELPPLERRNQFTTVVQRFLSVFAQDGRPLVLVLDDLQWIDDASLALLAHLAVDPDVRNIFVIGMYREDDVPPAHRLAGAIDALRNQTTHVSEMHLPELRQADVANLLADSFHCEREHVTTLAGLIYERTAGNPFFVSQFLTTLYQAGFLTFDALSAAWTWDTVGIANMSSSDDVVDLVLAKLNRLPAETRDCVKALACLGTSAHAEHVSVALNVSSIDVDALLAEAERRGLIQHFDRVYSFSHDRVHQAAYALLSPADAAELHVRIGRRLAAGLSSEKRDEHIFEVVHQLNLGASLIVDRSEREFAATLNLTAGMRAMATTASRSAASYLEAAASLLRDDCWETQRELAFAVRLSHAECAFLAGDLHDAEARLVALSAYTSGFEESAAVTFLNIALFTTLGQVDRAVDAGLTYLRRYGVDWPRDPDADLVEREYRRMADGLGSRSIESLAELPAAVDAEQRTMLGVLVALLPPAMFTNRNLHDLIALHAANISMAHGNCDGSCLAYSVLSAVLVSRRGDYDSAFRFGTLAVTLTEQPRYARFRARVRLMFAYHVLPWNRPLHASLSALRDAFALAKATGDATYAAYASNHMMTISIATGAPLGDVQREGETLLDFILAARYGLLVDCLNAQLTLIRGLRGVRFTAASLTGSISDQAKLEEHLAASPASAVAACWYWIRKLQYHVFMREYDAALIAAEKARGLLWTTHTHFEIAEYHFFAALSHAATCHSARGRAAAVHVQAIHVHRSHLAASAARFPETFLSRLALLDAEIARIEGRGLDAMRLYEDAIGSARVHGFVQNEALASEAASHYHAELGLETPARAYLQGAHACYSAWGADAKVHALEQAAPYLLDAPASRHTATTLELPVSELHLETIVQASHAVSSEIVLDKLIRAILILAVQHAGADRAVLLLKRNDEMSIVAEATIDGETVRVTLAGEHPHRHVPETVLQAAARTNQVVVVDDGAGAHAYSADAYIASRYARSLLCLPLASQGTVTGLLYLENSLASGVFTRERIGILSLLGTQAAISLENARLYGELSNDARDLRLIIDTMPALAWAADTTGEMEYVNARIIDYVQGTEHRTVEPPCWAQSIHPDEREHALRVWGDAVASGEPYLGVFRLRRYDGVYRWFEASCQALRATDGNIVRWYGLLLDIDDRKNAGEALRQTQEQLSRAMQIATGGELAAAIAHEVNQPLTAIVANGHAGLNWLAADPPNLSKVADSMRSIIQGGQDAGEIVRHIRQLFKGGEAHKAPVDVNALIDESLRLLSDEATRRQVMFETDLCADLPRALGEQLHLQQLIVNLLRNALDALDEIEDRPKLIRVTSLRLSAALQVTVRDNGIGVRDEHDIFVPFFTTKASGMGIGLAICRSIVEAHEGRLWVEHEAPHGSAFCFLLPIDDGSRT